MFTKLIVIPILFMLTGCSFLNKTITEYVFIKPPLHTHSDIVIPKPMNVGVYTNASDYERDEICVNIIQEHQDAFYELYISRKALSKWIYEQEMVYGSK